MSQVNHPTHYNTGKIEVIEFLEDKFSDDPHLWNAVKYLARAGKKDPAKFIEDLEKAIWYIRRRIEIDKDTPRRPNEMAEKIQITSLVERDACPTTGGVHTFKTINALEAKCVRCGLVDKT